MVYIECRGALPLVKIWSHEFVNKLVRLHVKVPGWLLNLNALLTKKLPKFLSRLNEMSGGRENMCLVSGSLRRILKFLRMTFLIARFCGW